MTDNEKLASRYAKEIALWQVFLKEHGDKDNFGNVVFEDMAIGFFIAHGVNNEVLGGDDFSDTHALAYQYGG